MERRDERSAKVVRWAAKPASSQCNVRLCETRYSTTKLRLGQCGQIHETLKGSHRPALQLQIGDLVLIALEGVVLPALLLSDQSSDVDPEVTRRFSF